VRGEVQTPMVRFVVDILYKQLTDSPGTLISDAKDLGEVRTGSSSMGAPNVGGVD